MIDLKESNFTRNKPDVHDIIGTWIPTDETLQDIRVRGEYPEVTHELILKGDGSFVMTNMPDWWADGTGKSNQGFDSGTGTWRLIKGNNIWEIWMIELEFPSEIAQIHLYRQKSPYLIFIRVGDPNNGYAMFFQRQSGVSEVQT